MRNLGNSEQLPKLKKSQLEALNRLVREGGEGCGLDFLILFFADQIGCASPAQAVRRAPRQVKLRATK
jgi:hypothetical protein